MVVVLAAVGAGRAICRSSDFRGFHELARALVTTGQVPLDRYPPTFYLLFSPLALLPLWAATVIWQGVNLASLLALPALLARLMRVRAKRQALCWLIVTPFLWDNLVLGQSGPVLLLLVTAGLLWARERMPVRGGTLLAVAAFLKAIPAVFLLIPAALGRLKGTALGVAISAVLAAAALAAAFGVRKSADWTGDWIHAVGRNHSDAGMLDRKRALRYNNQSLIAVLARTFGDIPLEKARGSTRLANLPPWVIAAANGAVQFVLLAAAVAAAVHARRVAADEAWAATYALAALLVLLLSPLVWTHYFIWWLPALVYLLKQRQRHLLVAVGLLAGAALSSVTLRGLGAHLLLTLVLYVLVLRRIVGCGVE